MPLGILSLFRRHTDNIILASASPRRSEILRLGGLRDFTVAPVEVKEDIEPGIPPYEAVMKLSEKKAAAASLMFSSRDIIIAADTIVWLDGRLLGKPRDEAEAYKMLSELSGRSHTVYTGVTVRRGDVSITEYEATQVNFRELEKREIRAYIRTGEPMDKAGAYGIQGAACTFVTGITGDYFNIMGLPAARVSRMLRGFGVAMLK
ncbi:MAG: Maf family protein [Oscillospiraceae bacterium]|jgi:septum formation protein